MYVCHSHSLGRVATAAIALAVRMADPGLHSLDLGSPAAQKNDPRGRRRCWIAGLYRSVLIVAGITSSGSTGLEPAASGVTDGGAVQLSYGRIALAPPIRRRSRAR